MNYKTSESRGINLKNIIWELLIQWKPLLLVGILCATLGFVFAYNNIPSDDEALDNKSIAHIKKSLTFDEICNVENTVRMLKFEKALADFSEGYSANYLMIQYCIDSETASDVSGLIPIYKNALLSNETNGLIHMLQSEDSRYADLCPEIDIVSVDFPSYTSGNVSIDFFSVKVMIAGDMDRERISKIVQTCMENEHALISANYPHDLNTISVMIIKSTEPAFSRITSIASWKVNNISRFSDNQKKLFDTMMENEGFLTRQAEPQSSSATAIATNLIVPFVGLVAGIFLYSVIFILKYILSGKVRCLDEVSDCYRIRSIDELHMKRNKSALDRFINSDMVYRFRYRKTSQEINDHISNFTEYVQSLAIHEKLNGVTVITVNDTTEDDQFNKEYLERLEKIWNDSNSSLTLEVSDDWIKSVGKAVPDGTGVILTIIYNVTKYKSIDKILTWCHDYDANILGAILIEC